MRLSKDFDFRAVIFTVYCYESLYAVAPDIKVYFRRKRSSMIDYWGRNIDNVIAHYNFAKHLIYFFSKDSLKGCCETNRIHGIFSFISKKSAKYFCFVK